MWINIDPSKPITLNGETHLIQMLEIDYENNLTLDTTPITAHDREVLDRKLLYELNKK